MSMSAAFLMLALGVFVVIHHTKSLENELINRMHIISEDVVDHKLYTLSPEKLKAFFISSKSYHKGSYQKYIQDIYFTYSDEKEKQNAYLSVVKPLPNGRYLYISSSSRYIKEEIKTLLLRLGIALVIALGIIIFGLLLLLHKLVAPLRCLVSYCNGKSTHLMECEGSYEVNSLRDAIVSLEKRNTILCKEKQDIFKEAAHEIKTPLAILKARLALFEQDEMDKESFISDTKEDIYRISNKLRELIFLKAIEFDILQSKKEVQMQSQCFMMQQLFRPILEKKDLKMVAHQQEDFTLYIHKEAIGRVMQAIFENIFMHTKNGTIIRTYIDARKKELQIVNEIGETSNEILFSSRIGSKLIERLSEKLEYEYTTVTKDKLFITTIVFKGKAPL